jgi:hypothetical protein
MITAIQKTDLVIIILENFMARIKKKQTFYENQSAYFL